MIHHTFYASASVIGKGHSESGLPNQDAFLVKEYAFGTVLVVADGLGSKKYSYIGSQSVCKAVCEATRIWLRSGKLQPNLLIRLIHSIWEINIHPYEKSDCGTTCVFAIVLKDGKLILGQLGDGLICYTLGQNFFVLNEKEEDFGNITNSMDHVRSSSEWNLEIQNIDKQDMILFLATDGVSEDLNKEKRFEYLHFLKEKISLSRNQRARNREIKNMLTNWVTKHSRDDKTMIVFYREVEQNDIQSNS